MDVRKSPIRAMMASKGRLRPAPLPELEYLENPFDEADTREHFVQICLLDLKIAPSEQLPISFILCDVHIRKGRLIAVNGQRHI